MSDFPKVAQPVNGGVRNWVLWLQNLLSCAFYCPLGLCPYQIQFFLYISSKLQQVVEDFQSLLNNKTLGTGEKREVASKATSILQTVESNVLEAALKAPDQEIQKVENSTVGKKTIRSDTYGLLVTSWAPD